ncbi:hypothetical protein chiPu_0026467, partial [Chiloscyllium punctatum]|nr:hypothetical protein [Chiloscyllium punctatum]
MVEEQAEAIAQVQNELSDCGRRHEEQREGLRRTINRLQEEKEGLKRNAEAQQQELRSEFETSTRVLSEKLKTTQGELSALREEFRKQTVELHEVKEHKKVTDTGEPRMVLRGERPGNWARCSEGRETGELGMVLRVTEGERPGNWARCSEGRDR